MEMIIFDLLCKVILCSTKTLGVSLHGNIWARKDTTWNVSSQKMLLKKIRFICPNFTRCFSLTCSPILRKIPTPLSFVLWTATNQQCAVTCAVIVFPSVNLRDLYQRPHVLRLSVSHCETCCGMRSLPQSMVLHLFHLYQSLPLIVTAFQTNPISIWMCYLWHFIPSEFHISK